MKEIEVVIRVSENSYKATCNGNMLPPDVENVVQGIKNGTPLPEGCGRLIDANKLIPDSDYEDGIFHAVSIEQINSAETIIAPESEVTE